MSFAAVGGDLWPALSTTNAKFSTLILVPRKKASLKSPSIRFPEGAEGIADIRNPPGSVSRGGGASNGANSS